MIINILCLHFIKSYLNITSRLYKYLINKSRTCAFGIWKINHSNIDFFKSIFHNFPRFRFIPIVPHKKNIKFYLFPSLEFIYFILRYRRIHIFNISHYFYSFFKRYNGFFIFIQFMYIIFV